MRSAFVTMTSALMLGAMHAAVAVTDFSGTWVLKTPIASAPATQDSASEPESRHGSRGHDQGEGGGMDGSGGMHHGMGSRGGHWQHGSRQSAHTASSNSGTDPRLNAKVLIIRQSSVVFDVEADGSRQVFRFDNRRIPNSPLAGDGTLGWHGDTIYLDSRSIDSNTREEYSL